MSECPIMRVFLMKLGIKNFSTFDIPIRKDIKYIEGIQSDPIVQVHPNLTAAEKVVRDEN